MSASCRRTQLQIKAKGIKATLLRVELKKLEVVKATALARFRHPDWRLYVGCYPNDPGTVAAVRKAGSADRMKVIQAIETGITLDMPSGKFSVDGTTHHCTMDVHLAEYQNKVPKIIQTFAGQPPSDTAAVCNLTKNPNDNQQYVIKVN